MFDFSKFATEEFPLKASALQGFVKCPWRVVSMLELDLRDEAGPAANTGSAVHVAIDEFHKNKDVVAAVEVMHGRRDEYPLADLDDATRLFLAYTQDPRNAGANVVLSEEKIKFSIKPHPEDKTQAPICVTGRLDQVRWNGHMFELYDMKTSTRDGPDLMADSLYQVAAYCVGASIHLGKTVNPGALILPRKYMRRGIDPASSPPGVFWHYTFTLKMCQAILKGLCEVVSYVRNGRVWLNAGDYCRWCVHRGIDVCVPRFEEWEDKREAQLVSLGQVR